MRIAETKVYTFAELSDEAKEKAREWYRDGALDYEWYDSVYEDAKTIGGLMGIDIDKIYFSGFWSQGDGACFEGHYEYKKGSVKAIKENAPNDTELHAIAEKLAKLQKSRFYRLQARIQHRGHYYHKYCTDIDVYDYNCNGEWCSKEVDDELTELLRDFMQWIYDALEREYEWLNSNEQVDESIGANEYEFTESGEAWQSNNKSISLGHYHISKISENGDVTAGCHYIKWDEIERVARQLEIYP